MLTLILSRVEQMRRDSEQNQRQVKKRLDALLEKAEIEIQDTESEPKSTSASKDYDDEEQDQPDPTIANIDADGTLYTAGTSQWLGPQIFRQTG